MVTQCTIFEVYARIVALETEFEIILFLLKREKDSKPQERPIKSKNRYAYRKRSRYLDDKDCVTCQPRRRLRIYFCLVFDAGRTMFRAL